MGHKIILNLHSRFEIEKNAKQIKPMAPDVIHSAFWDREKAPSRTHNQKACVKVWVIQINELDLVTLVLQPRVESFMKILKNGQLISSRFDGSIKDELGNLINIKIILISFK